MSLKFKIHKDYKNIIATKLPIIQNGAEHVEKTIKIIIVAIKNCLAFEFNLSSTGFLTFKS